MNLAHERITELWGQLKLSTIADALPHLAQKAITNDASLTEFLESVLKTEVAARLSRQRTTLTRLASFPAIKTLDGFDFDAATGVCKAQIQELASLAFIERSQNVVLLGQRHWQDPPCRCAGLYRHASRHQDPIHHGCGPVVHSDDCTSAEPAGRGAEAIRQSVSPADHR
jgi:hypothetical protein